MSAAESSSTALHQTPLHELHLELGARMVPFAGYAMPVQYPAGILAEHRQCRESAALFDVSHMGQVRLVGADAAAALETLVPVDVVDLGVGRQRYAFFTNASGGLLDDLMIVRPDPAAAGATFGDLFLADIKAYRDALCTRLGWRPHYPLFGSDTASLAREMIAGGLRARLCCVDTTQLDRAFAGRDFDASLLADLPAGIDPCGEHGEFHTCVSAGPMFAAPLDLQRGSTLLRNGRFAYTDYVAMPSVGAA